MIFIVDTIELGNPYLRLGFFIMKFAYNSCCDCYALNSDGIRRYNEIFRELPHAAQIEMMAIPAALCPITIQVFEEMGPSAGIHCAPTIFEINNGIIAQSGLDLDSVLEPWSELYRLVHPN